MIVELFSHPDFACPEVERLEVEVARQGAGLALRYRLTGRIGELVIPEPAPLRRADGLWQHTCFEAFLRKSGDEAYRELNFSPSGAWAAYDFTAYRADMRETDGQEAPPIECLAGGRMLELATTASLGDLAGTRLDLGLSAVIESRTGARSFFAAAHPPGKPDFHHSDCFAIELAPAGMP